MDLARWDGKRKIILAFLPVQGARLGDTKGDTGHVHAWACAKCVELNLESLFLHLSCREILCFEAESYKGGDHKTFIK